MAPQVFVQTEDPERLAAIAGALNSIAEGVASEADREALADVFLVHGIGFQPDQDPVFLTIVTRF